MQNALNASTLNCSSHRSAFRRLCGFVGAAGAGPAYPRHCPRALTCKVASQSREALRDTIASKERRRAAHPELHDLRQSSQIFGPRGLLLIGFSEADSTAVEGWMHRMEPTFVVSHCTAPMLDATLEEAVCDKSSGGFRRESFVRVDEVLPRLVLLSGMTGEESVAIAEHWEHFTGSRLPIFATCVPKLWRRPLREVLPAIVKSYVSSGAQQTDPAEASGLRDMIRKKMEQRKAQVGRRLIGRDAPIVVPGSNDSAAGVGGQEHAGTSAAAEPDMVQSHERDQRAVFRQQLARDAALSHPTARPGRRRAEKRGEGRAAKRGFG